MVKVGNSNWGVHFPHGFLPTFASFDLNKKMKGLDVRNSKDIVEILAIHLLFIT